MAVSSAAVYADADHRVVDVTATADADTQAVLAHGFGSTPQIVNLDPQVDAAYTARWTFTADATNVTVAKSTAAGSGNAAAQLRVSVYRRRPTI